MQKNSQEHLQLLLSKQLHQQPPSPLSSSLTQYLQILSKTFPICLAIIFEMTLLTVNLSNLSSPAAKVGLGYCGVLIRSLPGSLIFGFNYGYAIFASRTYGAKNFEKYKLYFLQGLINLSILILGLITLCYCSYEVTKWIGQTEEVALNAQMFARNLLPAYICFFVSHFVKMTLQAQEKTQPLVYVDGTSIVFHIVSSYVLGHYIQQESLVIITTNVTSLISLGLTLVIERKYSEWQLSRDLLKAKFEEYFSFVKECTMIALPLSLDIFVFQFMTLYVGSYNNIAQSAAQIIINNIFTIIASIFVGISSYVGTKVGNLIGLNQPREIKSVLFKIIKLILFLMYSFYFFLYTFQDYILSIYTSDPLVVTYIKPLIKLLAIFFVADMMQFIMSVYYRSLGLGTYVVKMFFFCTYGIGMVSMVLLGMVMEHKIVSCWLGYMIGAGVLNCLYFGKWKEIDIERVTGEFYEKVRSKRFEEIGEAVEDRREGAKRSGKGRRKGKESEDTGVEMGIV